MKTAVHVPAKSASSEPTPVAHSVPQTCGEIPSLSMAGVGVLPWAPPRAICATFSSSVILPTWVRVRHNVCRQWCERKTTMSHSDRTPRVPSPPHVWHNPTMCFGTGSVAAALAEKVKGMASVAGWAVSVDR